MKIRWPVIAVLVIVLVLAIAGGITMFWRFFIFFGLLLIAGNIWLRYIARHIKGNLDKYTQFSRVGEYLEETFTVKNNANLPMFLLEINEVTDLPGYSNRVKFSLPSGGSYTWHSRGLCPGRGQYRIGSLRAKIYDPLGLFSITSDIAGIKYLNVAPAVIDLPDFKVLPRREPGMNTRRWFAGEPGQNASRVREYFSGDSLRHIHWHSTAHTGQLMVKEYDPDLTRSYYFDDIWIILDLHRDTALGEGEETIAEYGIKIAASLVKKYLDEEKKVAFMVSGDNSYLYQPDNSLAHEQNINRALALLKPSGSVHLDSLITSQEERITPGSAVIVITCADYTRLSAPLHRLLNRGSASTVILLDPLSFGGDKTAVDTSRALTAIGINTLIVKRGDDISRSLDVRSLASNTQNVDVLKPL